MIKINSNLSRKKGLQERNLRPADLVGKSFLDPSGEQLGFIKSAWYDGVDLVVSVKLPERIVNGKPRSLY